MAPDRPIHTLPQLSVKLARLVFIYNRQQKTYIVFRPQPPSATVLTRHISHPLIQHSPTRHLLIANKRNMTSDSSPTPYSSR
ncbi:hypothetical protein LX32DRAFT_642329, partial [Colletotrichum zoysiae]